MMVSETLSSIRYVTDAEGNKTDVLIPVSTWKSLLLTWQRLMEEIEDQEDKQILEDWLQRRAVGEVNSISLDELEQELIADGLLSS